MMDLSNIFPRSKIKAQILRDDDVGRLSSKAVELIGACSALFVNDLVRSKYANDSAPSQQIPDTNVDPTPAISSGKIKSLHERIQPTKKSRRIKTEHDSTQNEIHNGSGPIDLDDIKNEILKRPECNFLEGILDDLTEGNSHKYDAAAKRRLKEKNEPKHKKETKTKPPGATKPIAKSAGNTEGGDLDTTGETGLVGVDSVLNAAIVDAQTVSLGKRKEIIEDEDDYD